MNDEDEWFSASDVDLESAKAARAFLKGAKEFRSCYLVAGCVSGGNDNPQIWNTLYAIARQDGNIIYSGLVLLCTRPGEPDVYIRPVERVVHVQSSIRGHYK